MAPIPNKRRREEDDDVRRRPKKKKVWIKRQEEYHSSSEEDEVELDVPHRQAARQEAELRMAARPKPVLKNPTPVGGEEDGGEGNAVVEHDEEDELLLDTALNTGLAGGDVEEADTESDVEVEEGLLDDHEIPMDDEPGVDAGDANTDEQDSDDAEDDDGADDDEFDDEEDITSMTSSQAAHNKTKRKNPAAFATSISKILETKLTTAKRADPVLSRSKSVVEANKSLADAKLEHKARAQIRAEKRAAADKGRVKDVLGLETESVDTGGIVEEEKRLKKTAQRGVVKLFNAVRAAQVKAEAAMREARKDGVVGMKKREERVNEMSKQGFLDLISRGGTTTAEA